MLVYKGLFTPFTYALILHILPNLSVWGSKCTSIGRALPEESENVVSSPETISLSSPTSFFGGHLLNVFSYLFISTTQ
jgi:hypothetical protein